MNSKKIITTLLGAGMLVGCADNKNESIKIVDLKNDTTQSIKDTLTQKRKNVVDYNISTTGTETFSIPSLIKEKDPAITIADSKSLLWMLGELDVNEIIKKYNPQIAATRPESYNRAWHDVRSIDTTLQIPYIFPSMKDFYTVSLDSFLIDKPEITEQVGEDKTVIIITELPSGKFGLGYYENGILTLAYPISIGDGKRHKDKKTKKRYQGRSPQGRFWIKRKQPRKKSFANDSMAYFLEVIGERGIGLHGQKTQSKLQSHGCFRQPQFAAKMLSEKVIASEDSTIATPLVSFWNPHPIELDSTKYYTKIHPELKNEWLQRKDTVIKKIKKDTINILNN